MLESEVSRKNDETAVLKRQLKKIARAFEDLREQWVAEHGRAGLADQSFSSFNASFAREDGI